MQRRVFVALGLAALCLLTSCQSRPPVTPHAADPAPRLTLDQAAEDLDYFFKTIEKTHPNHLANLSKQEYRQLQDRSRAAVERANEETGCVSRRVLALAVAEAAATLGDGHTSSYLTADLLDPCDASACRAPDCSASMTGRRQRRSSPSSPGSPARDPRTESSTSSASRTCTGPWSGRWRAAA
jgi:hypothetical protein